MAFVAIPRGIVSEAYRHKIIPKDTVSGGMIAARVAARSINL
jgi:hypothetical protein